MTDFKVGDRVQVMGEDAEWYPHTGEVTVIYGPPEDLLGVYFVDGSAMWFGPDELRKVGHEKTKGPEPGPPGPD